ncbi:MAG: hypothetical protein ABIP29_07445, partial [Candidatus Eisenbacteria bacterium]
WSARYEIADASSGRALGAVKRQGMKSLWKAHYDILVDDQPRFTIRGENGWVSLADGFLGELPVIGMLYGYLFHPAYLVTPANETPVMRLEKQPAFFEGKFTLEKKGTVAAEDEERILLSLVMMLLLERDRG